jgi:hypothetical protein
MLDRKYRNTYRMSFLAFEQLVAELTPFLLPTVQMFVRPPIPIRKQVCLVVYRLVYGFSFKAMNNLYSCRESIIRKYTLIVCRVLSSRNGLFGAYIHPPRRHRLMDTTVSLEILPICTMWWELQMAPTFFCLLGLIGL